jgi:hypothetical protein
MSYMFEVYYRLPANPEKDAVLSDRIASFGGRLNFLEISGKGEPGGVCLTFEFDDPEQARKAAETLRRQGEHVEGPADYGSI